MKRSPIGWAGEVKVKDVCVARAGHGFPLEFQGKPEGQIGFYKVGDISRNWQEGKTVLGNAAHYISREEAAQLRAEPFPSGTVVFAKIGAAVALNRRALLATDSLIDNNVMGLIPNAATISRYLFYFMCQIDLGARTRGGNVPSLRNGDVEEIDYPLPPLNEQRRIVAKIEELFSELDKGIENLKQARAQLAVYRQALLKHAFEGKLTADWRAAHAHELESAEELLAQLLADRKKKWMGRGRYAEPESAKTDDVGELPESWIWASPEQLSSFENYSLAIGPFGSNLKVSDYKESGVPLVFVRNIRATQFSGERTIYITADKAEGLRAHAVTGGDILITKMGEPPGDTAIYPKSQPDAVITADCIKLRLSPLLPVPRFFLHAISSGVFRLQIIKISSGVAQQKVSLGRFSTLALPLPPIEEQERIVNEVDAQISSIDALESDIDTNLQKAEALRQSILKKAFAGQLVPQDPHDEPAAVLLARLRAERATAAKPAPRAARKPARKTP